MLYFDNINANGEYTVAASCSGNEWSLSGSYTVSDAIGVGLTPSYSHNFQIVHDYVEPDVKNSSIVYSDALGRQLQSIEVNATPDGKDIVSFVEYDNMGRKDAQVYLPFAGDQNGLFYVETDPSYTNESFSGLTYMQESYWTSCAGWEGSYAYTEKVYDQSPLGVVLQTNGLGQNARRELFRLFREKAWQKAFQTSARLRGRCHIDSETQKGSGPENQGPAFYKAGYESFTGAAYRYKPGCRRPHTGCGR